MEREANMNAILHENRSHYYYRVTVLPKRPRQFLIVLLSLGIIGGV